jgi:predicted nucleic acid-binding protein
VTSYVDTSALLKRYVEESDSDHATYLLNADPVLVTSWVTLVEARRNLARLLNGAPLRSAQRQLTSDFEAFALVSCEESVASLAAEIGETLGVRSLDAIHLATAKRLQIPDLSFVTFDLRQAQAARSLGLQVLGA